MNIDEIRRCFYVPGKPGIIDAVHPVTGRGAYGGRTLEEIRADNPGAQEGDLNEVVRLSEDLHKSPPVEVTRERFGYMLEVLPPVSWTRRPGEETFKMSERTYGNVTAIFCRIGDRYFELADSIRTPHDEIVRRCAAIGG